MTRESKICIQANGKPENHVEKRKRVQGELLCRQGRWKEPEVKRDILQKMKSKKRVLTMLRYDLGRVVCFQ